MFYTNLLSEVLTDQPNFSYYVCNKYSIFLGLILEILIPIKIKT